MKSIPKDESIPELRGRGPSARTERKRVKAMSPGRTPADPTATLILPETDIHNVESPAYYLNRELTWLNFNFRVLHEAEDERTPLLERVKFVAIVSSNIDEFFMKRIGGLKQQVGAGLQDRTVDGMTPADQILRCYEVLRTLEDRQRQVFLSLLAPLDAAGITLARFKDLSSEDRSYVRDQYIKNIFPLVTPQATDPAHPFPFVSNLSLNLLVTMRYPGEQSIAFGRVKVPVGAGIPRFLKLETSNTFVTLEDVMAHNLDLLFPGMEIEECELFRVTRNANTELEEDQADDLLELIETGLRERRFAPIVRVEVSETMNPQHRGRLAAELGLDEQADVFEMFGLMAMRDLMELTRLPDPELHYVPHHPTDHPVLKADENLFHVIRDQGSVMLSHPYHSFSTTVERFLREASVDPKVRAIKMTVYRTSDDSKIIDYLIEAARNGKQVAVVLELKARFDEAANIRWANRLERRGVHVTYGVVGLKTHCKAILVVRQDYDALRRYAHIGTGNYHAGTARQYSDVGLLTCDDAIGHDLTELFNYLTTGYRPRRNYLKLLPAPKILKQALIDKIKREMDLHTKENSGHIQFKMNALEDADIVRTLYEASQAGVRVDLLVRDTCRLRPGLPGLSENIRVTSLVGRFLEHARVYYFANGDSPEYYIGSADCMRRNLVSRVEILVPIEDPASQKELRFMFDAELSDNRYVWEMQSDGAYFQRQPGDDQSETSLHQTLIDRADKRIKQATRLKRRKPRALRDSRLS